MAQDQPRLLATWNSARDVWETGDPGLFCEHSDVWSETFPTSVMWDRSGVYELPTSAPRTDDSATSSLLPTPNTHNWKESGNCRDFGADLTPRTDVRMPTREISLLPTPAVNDMGEGKTVEQWDEWTAKMKAAHGNGNGHGASLSIEAQRLLPTPTSRDWKDGGQVDAVETNGLLGRTVWPRQNWGQYADAIARWEALTRPAPAPTQPSKKGTPQLSAAFSEWLMGLPAGWVTDVPGITRNEALKALGNGVVPAQAAAALRLMLTHQGAAA